jgi:hypothetical protein
MTGLWREICVRTVRSGPIIGFQGVGADGWADVFTSTVRIAGYRPQITRR